MDAFTRRNRARIPLLLLLATVNYCFAVVIAAVIGGVTIAVTILLWVTGEGGWTPSSTGELQLVGVVFAAIAVIGAVGGVLVALIRFPTLRRRLEERVVAEGGVLLVDHDDETRVRNVLEGLAIAAGVPAPRFVLVDDEAPNAFGVGTRPRSTLIGVTTGLVRALSRAELEAVLAYEITRIASWDVALCSWTVAITGDAVAQLEDTGAGWLVGRPFARIARRIQAWALRGQAELRDVAAVAVARNPAALIGALEHLADDPQVPARVTAATAPLWVEAPGTDFTARIATLRRTAGLPVE